MATTFGTLTRPVPGADAWQRSRHRSVGLGLAVVGLALATVSLAASLVAGELVGQPERVAVLATRSFGLATAASGTIKFGIGVILLGIVRRIWLRVESVKAALPALGFASPAGDDRIGPYESPFGPATSTAVAPRPLLIHRMAQALWAPMLLMGAMLVYAGLALSFVAAGSVTADPAVANAQWAWVQGRAGTRSRPGERLRQGSWERSASVAARSRSRLD